MTNERIDRIQIAAGETLQLRFDLSDEQLLAVARAAAAVRSARYTGVAIDADAVSEMRELTALGDAALERARDGYCGGTLVVTVARLGLLVQVLREWVSRHLEMGFLRSHDAIDLPIVDSLLDEIDDLHRRALQLALGAGVPV